MRLRVFCFTFACALPRVTINRMCTDSVALHPGLDEVREYAAAGQYTRCPVAMRLLSDFLTPVGALAILKNASDHVFLLESAGQNNTWGRYTFLGLNPSLEVTARDGQVTITPGETFTAHPSQVIRDILARYRSPKIPGMPTFTGGLVGYFAYDYVKYAEPSLQLAAANPHGFNDVDLMLFETVIAFDNYAQTIQLITNIDVQAPDLEAAYARAAAHLQELAQLLVSGTPSPHTHGRLTGPITAALSEAEFTQLVRRAQHYIHEGDIFQIVPSNALSAPFEGSLFDTYRVLRTINPSPYMFYFSGDAIEIAGASPETLVKLADGVLHTFPLAGTRPRGKTPAEDEALATELLADPKERAEHNMLVDLGRNDIGKISEFGTVEVEKYMEILRFSHVMHIGSVVRGKIRADKDALDAVEALLPAGTLSGAPKIRAMEIISELEGDRRGLYGGALGYLDFSGNLDVCIAIRCAYKAGGRVWARSGAGIVQDSVPETEYRETVNKAAAMLDALRVAEELIGPGNVVFP